jgi:hypothetical protein
VGFVLLPGAQSLLAANSYSQVEGSLFTVNLYFA